jgi:hypothetical protein
MIELDGTTAAKVSIATSLMYILLLSPSNSITAFDTVTLQVLVMPFATAEIVAVPLALAVTLPLASTVATEVLLLLNVAVASGVAEYVIVKLSPTYKDLLVGVIVNCLFVTVTAQDPLNALFSLLVA